MYSCLLRKRTTAFQLGAFERFWLHLSYTRPYRLKSATASDVQMEALQLNRDDAARQTVEYRAISRTPTTQCKTAHRNDHLGPLLYKGNSGTRSECPAVHVNALELPPVTG